jgi:putative addiction module antidote
MTQKLLRVGSSAAVTIPKKSLKELGLKIGDEVRVSINPKERKVTILPADHLDVDKKVLEWTDHFIKRYRSALEALADK